VVAEVWEVAAELGVNVISIGGGTEELKEDEDAECLDPAMLGCTGGSGRWGAGGREPLCDGCSADGGSGWLGASKSTCHTLQANTWSEQGCAVFSKIDIGEP